MNSVCCCLSLEGALRLQASRLLDAWGTTTRRSKAEGLKRLQAGGGALRHPCNDATIIKSRRDGRHSVVPSALMNCEPFRRGYASLHPCLCSDALSVLCQMIYHCQNIVPSNSRVFKIVLYLS